MLSATLWIILGVLMGLTLALGFAFPDLSRGIPWVVLRRLRPALVNTVLFAWLSGAMMGTWLYIVPRLTSLLAVTCCISLLTNHQIRCIINPC